MRTKTIKTPLADVVLNEKGGWYSITRSWPKAMVNIEPQQSDAISHYLEAEGWMEVFKPEYRPLEIKDL